jgi:hypothetical protein
MNENKSANNLIIYIKTGASRQEAAWRHGLFVTPSGLETRNITIFTSPALKEYFSQQAGNT